METISLSKHNLELKSSKYPNNEVLMHFRGNHDIVIQVISKDYGNVGDYYPICKFEFYFNFFDRKKIKSFLKNKISFKELMKKSQSILVRHKYSKDIGIGEEIDSDFEITSYFEFRDGLFKDCVQEHILTGTQKQLIDNYIKENVPKPIDNNNKEEFRVRAYMTAIELQKNELIDDFVMLEFNEEFFWFILKTKYDMDYLYSRINLTFTTSLYDFLFDYSLNNDSEFLLNHIRENVLVKHTKQEIKGAIGSYTPLFSENNFEEVFTDEFLGIKRMVIKIKE